MNETGAGEFRQPRHPTVVDGICPLGIGFLLVHVRSCRTVHHAPNPAHGVFRGAGSCAVTCGKLDEVHISPTKLAEGETRVGELNRGA